jgi:hypothetical protein
MRRRRVWRGAGLLILLVPAVTTLLMAGAGPVSAATLNVCLTGCPYTQIAPAVAAARDGDTINVGPGTYRGGITIDVSIRLAGAGAGSTVIRGGAHVLTMGAFGASREPAVSVSGVTITGGIARSSPESTPLYGEEGVAAGGGGVEIPPQAIPTSSTSTGGATVTISNSVITGNRVDPATAVPDGRTCPDGPCPEALAVGGGIESWGDLTLVNTVVSGNTTGPAAGLPPVASDSEGAGIFSWQGSVTLTRTLVADNHATADIPNGITALGGGICVGDFFFPISDSLTIRDSTVTGNGVSLTSNLPEFADGQLIGMFADSGGVKVENGIPTLIENTAITNNTVTATDPFGEPLAVDGAMFVRDSPLTMRNSTISGNRVFSTVATTTDSGPGGGALEADGGGIISNTRITGNTATNVTQGGDAGTAGAGLAALNFTGDPRLLTVRGGVISGNNAVATTSTGSATVQGVGISNDSLLALDGVLVSGNTGKAVGPAGAAQGGGIWNGTDFSGPPVQLTLDNTTVTRNSLTGSPGITLQGAGLFTTVPVTLTHSLIALNSPDQCFGCTSSASPPRSVAAPPANPSIARRHA